jgi:hypothetical protein
MSSHRRFFRASRIQKDRIATHDSLGVMEVTHASQAQKDVLL